MIFRASRFLGLAVILFVGPVSGLSAESLKYGNPSFPSLPYDYNVSPDGAAWTVGLVGFQATADDGKTAEGTPSPVQRKDPTDPVVTRTFSIVIPAKSSTPVNTNFYLQGVSAANEGGKATLLVLVNGQSSVFTFPKSGVDSYLHTVNFSAASATEIRLTLVLIAERDTQFRGASAMLDVTSIDTDATRAKQRAANRQGR